MGIFSFFRRTDDGTARMAKDRLQVLIAHERSGRDGPDYLPLLLRDILEVIKRYVAVGDDALSVQIESQDDCDILELNITLPETAAAKTGDDADDTSGTITTTPSAEARRRAMLRRHGETTG